MPKIHATYAPGVFGAVPLLDDVNDLNTLHVQGIFSGSNLANAPDNGPYIIQVVAPDTHIRPDGVHQTAIKLTTGTMNTRIYTAGAWTAWTAIGSGGGGGGGPYDPEGTADAVMAAHLAASDPHPQYLLPSEADALYDANGAASSAIAAHLAATDPHTQYLTAARGDARYDALGTADAALAAYTTADITVPSAAISFLDAVIPSHFNAPYNSYSALAGVLAPSSPATSLEAYFMVSEYIWANDIWGRFPKSNGGSHLVQDLVTNTDPTINWDGADTATTGTFWQPGDFVWNYTAGSPPTTNLWFCLDNTTGAALWIKVFPLPGGGGGATLSDGDYGDIVVSSSGTGINIDSAVMSSFARTYLDDTTGTATRATLGLAIGTDVQAWDTDLDSIAALTTASFGRSLLTMSNAGAVRTAIGTVIGTDVQAWDADLDAIAALVVGKGKLMVGSATAWNALAVATDGWVLTLDSAQTLGVKWAAPSGGASLGATLTAIDSATYAGGDMIYFSGPNTPATLSSTTTFGRGLLTSASAAALRATAGTVIGTDVQAFDATILNQAAGDARYEPIARQFDTRTAAIAATVPGTVNWIRTAGYAAVGDLGGALYKRVASQPSHAGKFQSADGTWWELSSFPINPFMFGAAGDNSTDDKTPLTNAFAYIASRNTYNNTMAYPLTGLGRAFATSVPQVPPSYIHIYDITFKALTGASWSGGNGTALSFGTQGVLTLSGGFQRLRNVQIDCNRITGVQGIYAAGPNYQNSWENILVKNWKTNGNGIVLANYSLTEARNVDCLQYVNGDSEYTLSAQRTGVGMMLIGQTDSIFISCNWANALTQLYVDVNSHHNRFTDCHPYCVSAPSTPTANPGGIIYDGYQNVFDGLYLDVVPFLCRTSASSALGKPSVTFTNVNGLYDSSNSTYSSWLQFTTSLANTPLTDVRIDNVQLNTVSVFSFATTGSGSWAHTSRALTTLGAAAANSSIQMPGGTQTQFMGNIDMLGTGVLTGYLTTNITDTSSARTLSADDSGKLILMTLNNTLTVTAPKNMQKGLDVLLFCPNHAGTVIAETGGSINGLTTGITLTQNQLYRLVWLFGTGANAQYCLMGGLGGGGSSTLADGDYGDIIVSGTGTAINFDSSVVTTFAKTFLDDVAAVNVRSTLGLAIGTNVQAWDADLDTWATLTPSANAQTLVGHTFSQMRSDLGLVIGTNVQAWDADLDAIAALTVGKGKVMVGSATAWSALAAATDGWVLTLDSAQTLGVKWAAPSGGATLADGDYGDIIVSGTGTAINFDSSVVTTFAKTFLDDIAATNVRTTLGLAIGSNVQAWDADLDAIAALASTKGNLIVGTASGWNVLAVGTDTFVLTADSAQTSGLKWAAGGSGSSALPRSYLAGLGLKRNTTTPTTKIDIAAGTCRDDANSADMTTTGVTIDATTVGANGLQTGSLAASTWYHVYLISGTSGTAGFLSTSLTPTLPTGYTTSKRRIGSVKTNASSQFLAFQQLGDKFLWDTPTTDLNVGVTASAILGSVNVPPGVAVEWEANVLYSPGTVQGCLLTCPDSADTAPDTTSVFTLLGQAGASTQVALGVQVRIRTNTSQQIRYRMTSTSGGGVFRALTTGWLDRRGQDA